MIIHNIGELCTLAGGVRMGSDAMNEIGLQKNAGIVIVGGRIEEIGPSDRVLRSWSGDIETRINAGGRAAVPGLVDCHTHAVFASDRAHEFEARMQGKSYKEVLDEGGGILYTTRVTRDSTRAELLKALLQRLDRMMDHGTTTVEVKSGYGLETHAELRLLEVMEAALERHPIDIVPTFMGAHAVPQEFKDAEAYSRYVVEDMLPKCAPLASFIDVFCEQGVFDVDQSRRILEAGHEAGLGVKVHADELSASGGGRLAAELGAVSAEHLLHTPSDVLEEMLDEGVIPVLLPAAAFNLGDGEYADASAMMDAGAPVALATDFNPNCFTESLPFVMALACRGMGMSPAEALSATTVNAAAALGMEEEVGSLEPGRKGDVLILDASSHVHLPYHMGVNVTWKVVKEGTLAVDLGHR